MANDPHRGHKRLLVGAGLTTAVVAAPHVLPLIGVGNAAMANEVVMQCSSAGFAETGLAGAINGLLSSIPGIGSSLAGGGWIAAAASGGIGIGGVLLGNYVHKHHDKPGHIQWGKIIKYAALATSMLIALPSILSGVSMGLTYLAFVTAGAAAALSVSTATTSTLGMMGTVQAGTAMATFAPHIMTCGAAALPAVGSLFLAKKQDKTHTQTTTQTWTSRISQQQADQIEASPSLA